MGSQPPLRAGIIAAGAGERLRARGALKPLVEVAGRALIDYALDAVAETSPAEVVIIINEESPAIRDHVEASRRPFRIDWLVRTTPSSMHSFLLVLERLAASHGEPVLISTVDTLVPAGAFATFVEEARRGQADVTLALTRFVDDEKPLLVSLEGNAAIGSGRVTAIGLAAAGSPLATAGYYFVHPRVLAEAEISRREGVPALRAFLERLLSRGYRIDGIVMPDSIDVDRPADVAAAEHLLR